MRDLDSTPQFGHDDCLTIGALNIGTRRAELDFANITAAVAPRLTIVSSCRQGRDLKSGRWSAGGTSGPAHVMCP
jgi:hypothetical protein